MKFHPPISERSDKELFNMISNERKWDEVASKMAYQELLLRSYSTENIESKKRKLQQLIVEIENRRNDQLLGNSKKSYSLLEMLLIILGFPIRLFINNGLLTVYWELDKYNYRRKKIQRVILTGIAIIFWGFILRIIL